MYVCLGRSRRNRIPESMMTYYNMCINQAWVAAIEWEHHGISYEFPREWPRDYYSLDGTCPFMIIIEQRVTGWCNGCRHRRLDSGPGLDPPIWQCAQAPYSGQGVTARKDGQEPISSTWRAVGRLLTEKNDTFLFLVVHPIKSKSWSAILSVCPLCTNIVMLKYELITQQKTINIIPVVYKKMTKKHEKLWWPITKIR
jgi:hypothetical protein